MGISEMEPPRSRSGISWDGETEPEGAMGAARALCPRGCLSL